VIRFVHQGEESLAADYRSDEQNEEGSSDLFHEVIRFNPQFGLLNITTGF
jgi:hypothetical protein